MFITGGITGKEGVRGVVYAAYGFDYDSCRAARKAAGAKTVSNDYPSCARLTHHYITTRQDLSPHRRLCQFELAPRVGCRLVPAKQTNFKLPDNSEQLGVTAPKKAMAAGVLDSSRAAKPKAAQLGLAGG